MPAAGSRIVSLDSRRSHPRLVTSVTAPPVPGPPTELPAQLTRFIGRDRELDALAPLIERERLVTLTGAGGSGKTRLALAAAHRVADAFARVAWVDLAAISAPEQVSTQVATALSVAERPDVPVEDRIAEAVCGRRTLVLLDNCEHVVEAVAWLVEALLRRCGTLSIVATSREALGVGSETAWLVPPLDGSEAVQLFAERARTALPSFAVHDDNIAAVREICERLDGIPLAIELAAARVRSLTPAQIVARLSDAFRLLRTGQRTAVARHRTLRATMEWSESLLSERERVLLRRLSVFAGGFGLEDAEAICATAPLEPDDILDGIGALVDKSWILMEPEGQVARYRLLETVRQFAAEALRATGEDAALRAAHGAHFVALLERNAPLLVGGSAVPGLAERLRLDQENFRTAATHLFADEARGGESVRVAGALFWLWYAFGSLRDLRGLLDRALAHAADADALDVGRALLGSGLTALAQGEYVRAQRDFEAAMPLLRAGGDLPALWTAMAKRGAAVMLAGDVPRAQQLLAAAVEATAHLPADDITAIFAHFWHSWASYLAGDLADARAHIQRNLQVALGAALPTAVAHSTAVLARIEIASGDRELGCRYAAEALEMEAALADSWGLSLVLDAVALLAAQRGRGEDAVRLMAGTHALRDRSALALPGVVEHEVRDAREALRAALGVFDACWSEGLALSTSALTTLATAEVSRQTSELGLPVALAGVRGRLGAAVSPRAALCVRALGALDVAVGARRLDASAWGSARARELLVYLLLHPEGRTKDQVGLAFWPDASPAQLRNSFHVTLHRLRRALGGAEWVLSEGERYRVDASGGIEFDVPAFEAAVTEALRAATRQSEDAAQRLEAALALYRGDFLDGEPVGDWHLECRERLQRQMLQGLLALGALHSRVGRPAPALEAYRRALARDPLTEEAVRGAMQACLALGDRAQAAREFARFRKRLAAEVGAQPAAETLRLAREL